MSGTPDINQPLNNAALELSLRETSDDFDNNNTYDEVSVLTIPLLENIAERPHPSTRLPRSLKIVVWNCCGITAKSHQILDLFE